MTTWFISRHQGAIDWAKRKGISVDRWVTHLDTEKVQSGDVVIGTLPIHLAEKICQKGARFLFLELNLKAEQRGKELNADEMLQAECSLVEYEVKSVPRTSSL